MAKDFYYCSESGKLWRCNSSGNCVWTGQYCDARTKSGARFSGVPAQECNTCLPNTLPQNQPKPTNILAVAALAIAGLFAFKKNNG